jgi:hypothetical protein
MFKDLARALSLSNLCFIISWNELLNSPIRRFNIGLAIIINVLALAAIFWITISLVRHSGNRLALRMARFFFPLVLLVPIKGLIRILLPKQKLLFVELFILLLVVLLIGLFEVRFGNVILRFFLISVLVLFPFFFIATYQAVLTMIPVPAKHPAEPIPAPESPPLRVLWLVFDELDQRLTFSDRPSSLNLPELDRLRRNSIFATNAFPPSDSTVVSMPALISGELLSNTELVNQRRLMITVGKSETTVNWNSRPNLFTQAREIGYSSAVIGWYIPYCTLIGDSVSKCVWIDHEPTTLGESIRKQVLDFIGGIPLASAFVIAHEIQENDRYQRRKHIEDYSGILQAAKDVIAGPSFGFSVDSLASPASPGNLQRRDDRFELNGASSYLDNLQLVDKTLGELRQQMEELGTWEDTIVLVTSDHWLRSFWKSIGPEPGEPAEIIPTDIDQRVPVLLKLSGQTGSVTYEPVFNTVLLHDLVLAL